MLTQTSTGLIARYYNEIASQPDVAKACDVAEEILTPDFIFHPPNDREGQHGLERHKQFLVWHHGVAPDQQYTIEDVVADSSRAALRWSLRGTHRGEFLGIPPTGRNFRLVGIDYLYMTDDKIAELWRSFDIRALIQQLTSDLAKGEAMYSHKHELEYLCSFNTGLTPPENIGLLAEGHRITAYHTGGQVSGPNLRGKVLPVGGDWGTLRTDGVFVIDARITIQTDDAALLSVSYGGLIDAGPEGYQMFLAGTFPPVLPVRTTPRFQTASPAYQWANRVVCIGIGELDLKVPEVRYNIYAVR